MEQVEQIKGEVQNISEMFKELLEYASDEEESQTILNI